MRFIMVSHFIFILSVATLIGAAQAIPSKAVTKAMEYREKCVALTGSDAGYQQVVNSIEPLKTCLLSRFDMQQLEVDMYQYESGARKPFLDKYCPKLNESMGCFDDLLEGVAKCIGHDVDQVKKILKDMSHNMLELVCRNVELSFLDAVKPEYEECIGQIKCELSDSTKRTSISKYGEEQCRDLDDTFECIQKKVEGCDAPGLVDAFRVVINTISKANDCKQYNTPDANTSNAIDGEASKKQA